MSDNKYTIKSGDTLSELAKIYNTTVDVLQSLNSDQIKELDSIFSGNTIEVPVLVNLQAVEHVQKQPLLSSKYMAKSDCSEPEYKYTAFIPEHPKTKKAEWLALTDEALKAIQDNASICKEKIVPSDKTKTLEGLASLGILDAFTNPLHEYFLQDEADKQAYKKYLFELQMIKKSDVSNDDFWVPDEYKDDQDHINASFQRQSDQPYSYQPYAITINPWLSYELQKRLLLNEITNDLTNYVEEFESKAQKFAQTQTIEEDGYTYTFAFHKQGQFYTSDSELSSFKAMERFLKARIELGFGNSALTKETIRVSTAIQSVEKLEAFYTQWKTDYQWLINQYNQGLIKTRKHANFRLSRKGIPRNRRYLLANLFQLNMCGYCIKEQPLTQDQLFHGAKQVDSIEFSSKRNAQINAQIDTFGYYSCEALHFKILKEVALRIKDYTELIGNTPDKQSYAASLLALSVSCSKRMALLQSEAEKRVKAGPSLLYCSPKGAAKIINDVPTVTQARVALLWAEHSWKPKNYQRYIINNPKENARSIVELFLSSEPDKPIYVLSDCRGISSDLKISLKHNKFLTPIVTQAAKASGAQSKSFTQAVTDMATQQPELKLLTLVKPIVAISESLYKKQLFTWCDIGGDNPIFGPNAEWAGGAQAQLFRFSSGLELGSERTVSDRSLLLGSIKAAASFDLFQASMAISVKIPEGDKGKKFLIPYVIDDKINGGTRISLKDYDAGEFQIELDAKVQGLVGVSCLLGSEIRIGAIEDDPNKGAVGLGIKGQSPALASHVNRVVGGHALNSGPDSKIATGVKTEAKIFAGVELGGEIGLKVNWKPPKNPNPRMTHTPKFMQLVSTSVGLNVSAGLSADMLFQFTYQNGKFLYIFEANSAMGVGFGGKIAMEVSPLSFDQMFDIFLSIAKEEGFRRVAFSKQVNENGIEKETFIRLNQILTIMVAYQLKASQVLMLPFHILETMEKNAKVERNAPIIANYINNASPEFIERAEKMYPETLAPILFVLSYYQTPTMWEGGKDKFGIKDKIDPTTQKPISNEEYAIQANQSQRKAILNLLKWICNASDELDNLSSRFKVSEEDKRQFEEAMQRMTLGIHEKLDKSHKWEFYLKGLIRLHDQFFKKAYNYRYNDELTPYKDSAIEDYSDFIILVNLLGANVTVYQQLVALHTPKYKAANNSALLNDMVALYTGAQESNPTPITEQRNQAGLSAKATIVPWTQGINS